jgi:hypothetical protein
MLPRFMMYEMNTEHQTIETGDVEEEQGAQDPCI